MTVTILDAKLQAAGIPIHGVSMGSGTPTSTVGWRIDYKPEATAQNITDGDALLAAHNPLALSQQQTDNQQLLSGPLSAPAMQELDDDITALGGALTLLQIIPIVRRIAIRQRAILKKLRYEIIN